MILIVGGAYQGKLDFVCSLLGADRSQMEGLVADGNIHDVSLAFSRPVIRNFHLYCKRLLQQGQQVEVFTQKLITTCPSCIVISDEIGSGIVPVNREDRQWRDETGTALKRLAACSDEVYQVVCGLANRIK